MAVESHPTAKAFCERFLKSYSKLRAAFTDDERWREIWTYQWNEVMLWQPTTTFHPPQEIQRSVLAQTADELGLHYENGEPLRLDAVFSSDKKTWFPILVAVEHENNCRGFESEVTKLLSVRCSLKVGITYSYTSSAQRQQSLDDIQRIVKENFAKISNVVGEDQGTEYLFLVGTEVSERPRELSWFAIDFRASEGPERRLQSTTQN